uniref:Uncharacterized protein n=1 Tax=Cacopsylla melanoneura TaxID=428564 RepID=A0A8D8S8S3_9HEMI
MSLSLFRWTWLVFVIITLSVMLLRCAITFFPINAQEYAHIQSVYGHKYPQNQLPQFLYIPRLDTNGPNWSVSSVDTSEPYWFAVLYLAEVYWAVLIVSMSTTFSVIVPFILLHFVGQHFVLSDKLRSLGKLSVGPNLLKPPPMGPRHRLRHYREEQKKVHRDLTQVRQCIVDHQKLVEFRALVRYIIMYNSRTYSCEKIILYQNETKMAQNDLITFERLGIF